MNNRLYIIMISLFAYNQISLTSPDITVQKQIIDLIQKRKQTIQKKEQKLSSSDVKDQFSAKKKSYLHSIRSALTSIEFAGLCIGMIICISMYKLYFQQPKSIISKNDIEKIIEQIQLEEKMKFMSLVTGRHRTSDSDIEQAKILDTYFSLGINPNHAHQIGSNNINLAETAAHEGFVESFATALKHGYKVTSDFLFDLCDPIYEENQTTKKAFCSNDLKILKLALQQKPNLDARDCWGQTILHRVQNAQAQAMLIAAGANIDATDNFGNKPKLTPTNRLFLKYNELKNNLLQKITPYFSQ